MKSKIIHLSLGAVVIMVLVLTGARAAGATPLAFDLSWWAVDNGGAMYAAADGYQLSATIGQPDAGTLSGGGYTLNGGFWGPQTSGSQPGGQTLYLPLVHK